MQRLPYPKYTQIQLIEACKSGIGTINLQLIKKINEGQGGLLDYEKLYKERAKNSSLYLLSHMPNNANNSSIVISSLCKGELINLYEYYFRNKKKPISRKFYDSIMLSADEKCPFCGGIGRPRNLDHYLPKAFFPHFSILPFNLIPACRDCNMDGKGESFSVSESQQPIHPYIDKSIFFDEQWVYGRLIKIKETEPYFVVEYYVETPASWNRVDAERAAKHFSDFDLAKRYSIEAAKEITTPINLRKIIFNEATPNEFKAALISMQDEKAPINQWKRVLYQTLANDSWFLNLQL